MDKSLGLDMDAGSDSSDNEIPHHDMNDHMIQYTSMNDSQSSIKMTSNANYLGRSRVFLDGHMSVDKSTGATVILCSYCQKSWAAPKTSSTGNYRKHLLKHHPYELSGKDGVVGQVRLRDGLLRWMISSGVGIEMFDDNFNQFLRNSFHVEIGKSRLSTSLLEILDKHYEASKAKVQNFFRLSSSQNLSPHSIHFIPNVNHLVVMYHYKSIVTLSDPSSLIQAIPQPNTSYGLASTNFITISGHFINEHWQLKNIVLGFTALRGYPTISNLTAQITETVGQYVDLSQITNVGGINSTENITLLPDSNQGLTKYKVFCIASTLQAFMHTITSCSFAVNSTSANSVTIPALNRLRTIIMEMYSSPANIETVNRIHLQIANAQQTSNTSITMEYTPIDLDQPNNWRSTLRLVSSVIEQKILISSYLNQQARSSGGNNNNNYHNQSTIASTTQLLQEDWRELHILRQILQSFETVISALSNPNQDMPTIPTVLPSLGWINDTLKELTTEISSGLTSPGLIHFLNLLKAEMTTFTTEVKKRHIYSIASALDPRLKLEYFEDGHWTTEEKNDVVQELGALFAYYSQLVGGDVSGNSGNNSSAASTAGEEVDTSSNMFYKRRKISSKQEWEVYLNTPVSSVEKQDPLSWWKEHSTSYPVLAQLIKDVFAIPASIAYSESNLNQGIDMIARFRRHKTLLVQKREQPLPLGQNQHPLITLGNSNTLTMSNSGVNSSSNSNTGMDDPLSMTTDERSIEELICLQSWAGVMLFEE